MNAMANPPVDNPEPETTKTVASKVRLTLIGESSVFVPLPDGGVVEVKPGEQWPAGADPSLFILPSEIWS